jgi:protein involved in polysaccharide export with SLBB domain
MRIAVLKILIIVSAAVLAGCSAGSTGLPTVGSITPNAASGPAPLGSGMQLQAGDKVRVTVFGEDKISGEYEIDLDGFLSLPLAGTMKAAGQNKMELEGIIATKLKSNYLKDPKVTVDVVTFRPIYVLGEVQKPGEYPYRSGLNVMSALAVAGGSTYRASNSRVMIQRFGEPVLKEYALDPSVAILPGDVIRLPERYF